MRRHPLALTIFLGSFLSFALEPMIGRTLLPVFGGTPSVWVTCLAAFQVLMVGGYFYAGKVKSVRLHVPLLAVAAIWCVAVALFRKPLLAALAGCTAVPAVDVLVCTLALCGLTFILLSANSSVVQILSGGDYRLYAVSNAGSLIGLLAYPLLFEPNLALTTQWIVLGVGIAVYAALLLNAARGVGEAKDVRRETKDAVADNRTIEQSPNRTILYLLIPALSCALLNATTSHLTLDVSPMPLLWAVLLALFLLSYIIGFSGKAKTGLWAVLAIVMAAAAAYLDQHQCQGFKFLLQLLADCGLVLCGSTFLHSYLYSIRPDEKGLARYYLLNVVGGAIGGVLTSIVAPLVFSTVAEFPLMIAVVALCVFCYAVACYRPRKAQGTSYPLFIFHTVFFLLALVALFFNGMGENLRGRYYVLKARGFFGTVHVMGVKARTASGAEGEIHEFVHGSTVHGAQVRMPGKFRMPTCYYTPEASGYAIVGHPKYRKGEPMRVNITGLGIGVLFSYGRTNDYYRAYEISKDALDIAMNTNLFSFVADCPAKKDVILQDARKGLEAELAAGAEPYDVIIVDAFTGDNLPYHLSSKEAFELYFKLLKPDGILCVNISNWHLALEPYVKKIGEVFDCPLLAYYSNDDFSRLSFSTSVAFFCRKPDGMAPPPVGPGLGRMINFSAVPTMKELPTDEKGSFVSLIRW